MSDCYNVWVGSLKVNDFYLSRGQAKALAGEYVFDGYANVVIEFVVPSDRWWQPAHRRPEIIVSYEEVE